MMLGGISDLWQREIMGIGPTGRDKGKGGKFLLLPPDYEVRRPTATWPAKSQTYGVVLGVRGFQVGGGTDQAVALMKTTRIYPLSQAANPPATTSSTARIRRSTRSFRTPASSSTIWPG